MTKTREPKTLQQAVIYFSDEENCQNYLASKRWPDGKVICPTCGRDDVSYLEKYKKWQCKSRHKKRQFSIKVGTIFEKSSIDLDKWLIAVWMLANCKNGVSSYEIARSIGVTQKTAWFMLQRIRLAMQDEEDGGQLGGEVEVDETFIGGKSRNMHKSQRDKKITGTGGKDKTIAFGMVEGGGKVRAFVMENRKKHLLQSTIRQYVEAGSALFSDELSSYDGLEEDYQHEVINHAIEYVRGSVHTNCMENFWGLLKRGLKGTYVSVEPFHLFRYLDEQSFRFNTRDDSDAGRFGVVMSQISDKRLTYDDLTGKKQAA